MREGNLTKRSEITAELATELGTKMEKLQESSTKRVTYKDMESILFCTPILLSSIDNWSWWVHRVEESELGRLLIKYIKHNSYVNYSPAIDVLRDFATRGHEYLKELTLSEFFSRPLISTVEKLHDSWMYVDKSTKKLIAVLHYCYYMQHRHGDSFFNTHQEQIEYEIGNILQSNLSSGNPHITVAHSCVEALRNRKRSAAEEWIASDICAVLHPTDSIIDTAFQSLGFMKLSDNPLQTRYRCLQNDSVSTVKYNNHSSYYLYEIQNNLLKYLKCREVENGGTITDDILLEVEGDVSALSQLVRDIRTGQLDRKENIHANT